MSYYEKYIKYKTKYINLKNSKGGSNNNNNKQPIECELINLAIFDYDKKFNKLYGEIEDQYHNKILKGCIEDKQYWTKWVAPSSSSKPNKQTLLKTQKPFKFKNSLGKYLENLYN